MTTFILEKTGESITAQFQWSPNGDAGELYIFAGQKLTDIGDILQSPINGERFFLGEHDLNGLMFRAKQHYKAGCFKITDSITISRNGETIASDLPAVVMAGPVKRQASRAWVMSEQKFSIALKPTDIRIGDLLILSHTGMQIQVSNIDLGAWDGKLVLIHGAFFR